MNKVQFTRDQMCDILYGNHGGRVVENKIVDKTRWSIIHDLIFEKDGKFYSTSYSVGATESQDESPWEYEDMVDCVEAHQVEKLMKVWEPVV